MIPKLTSFLVKTVWAGAEWVTELVISYVEMVIRAMVWAILAFVVADILIQASIRFDINALLVLGAAIGGGGLFYLAVVSSPGRMAAAKFAQLSVIAQEEIERLSNIMFLIIVTLFYLGIDQGQRHPTLLKVFLGMMVALLVIAILPGKSKMMVRVRERFQIFVLVPVAMMALLAVVPEAITRRVADGHWTEKATGTVSQEIPYRLDEQDEIINALTNQPMVFFDQIGEKNSDQPRPLIGWVRDRKNQYRLYRWFEGQKNYTGTGQEIKPVTTEKMDEIIAQTKHDFERFAAENKIVEDNKAAADKATADKESARLKAEADKLKAEAAKAKAEEERGQEVQRQADEIARQQAEVERTAQETAQEEQRQLALQPVSVTSTILESADESQDIVVVRPSEQFVYQGQVIRPDQTVVVLDITDVKPAPEKNKYLLTLQPSQLISDGQRYDISRRTGPVQLTVKKDSLWKSLKSTIIPSGIGAAIGGVAGGKKGAIIGAIVGGVAGHVFSRVSHGKKFQLTTGDPVPVIRINPVP